MNALTAAYYPASSRATGVGWASGIGRIGSVVGAVAGGWLVALGLGLPLMFAIIGIPALIACASLLAMNIASHAQQPSAASSPAGAE